MMGFGQILGFVIVDFFIVRVLEGFGCALWDVYGGIVHVWCG